MTGDINTGIEMELWVVDEQGRLCDGEHLAAAHERIEPEFVGPLLEVRTEPHGSEAELRRDLQSTLQVALEAAAADGRYLVPLGTPLSAADPPVDGERGRIFEAVYDDDAVSAKNCAGTHIHFEKSDVLDQLNLLTALDPALSLVSSSPYYLGERGEDSSRAISYRTKCGPALRRYCDLWGYADSLDAWDRRVECAYERFERLAAERGVGPERIETAFDPENTVLNPVRLRQCQPTVEWRAPDSALPSQVLRLTSDVRELVGQLEAKSLKFGPPGVGADHVHVPELPTLRTLSRLAIEDGLGSDRVRTYLQQLGIDPGDYQPISQQLYGPLTLSESAARKLRLEYARRLRADVEALTADTPRAPIGQSGLHTVGRN